MLNIAILNVVLQRVVMQTVVILNAACCGAWDVAASAFYFPALLDSYLPNEGNALFKSAPRVYTIKPDTFML